MGSLSEISEHLRRLNEINGIMTAMKSLSLVETRKLSRFIDHQRRMLANIEAAAADFLNFFAGTQAAPPSPTCQPTVLVLIGSERGFCGNFNDRLLATLAAQPFRHPAPALIVVGQRLTAKLEGYHNVLARLAGPTVTEDVPTVLDRLLDALQSASPNTNGDEEAILSTLAHEAGGEPVLKRLLPLLPPGVPPRGHPPGLQLEPILFFAELLDQYLLSALYGLLYESLLAENRQRLAHMEHALDRLSERATQLTRNRNSLRREKIIEEIEVILSSKQTLVLGHD